eukprot:2475342-Amphidinium_carterae.1
MLWEGVGTSSPIIMLARWREHWPEVSLEWREALSTGSVDQAWRAWKPPGYQVQELHAREAESPAQQLASFCRRVRCLLTEALWKPRLK